MGISKIDESVEKIVRERVPILVEMMAGCEVVSFSENGIGGSTKMVFQKTKNKERVTITVIAEHEEVSGG